MMNQTFLSDATDATAGEPPGVEDARAHDGLQNAYAHVGAGELEDALQECDRAIQTAPGWAEAHNLRGIILDEMGQLDEAIAAFEEAVRLDAGFVEAAENLAGARAEGHRAGRRRRRLIALGVPMAALIVALVAFAVAEGRRGPDWQRELDRYIAQSALPSETVTIRSVAEANEPQNFSGEMGRAAPSDWRWGSVTPPLPPAAVQCVLLERARPPAPGSAGESVRQVVYVAYHTDALYRVGWLTYEGPEDPFAPVAAAHLSALGCGLGLE
jgi:tetratricopeptide (TPR) repeat protein